jgi:hypothetical protein
MAWLSALRPKNATPILQNCEAFGTIIFVCATLRAS